MTQFFNKFLIEKFIFYGLHLASFQSFLNPNLKAYLCGVRKKMNLFDLKKIFFSLRLSFSFLSKIQICGKKILFVGCPLTVEKDFSSLCTKHGHFYLTSWTHGFLKRLKKSSLCEKNSFPSVIVVFSTSDYSDLIEEAAFYDIPIVAFLKGSDSTSKIDYPVFGNYNSPRGGIFFLNIFHQLFLLDTLKTLPLKKNKKKLKKKNK